MGNKQNIKRRPYSKKVRRLDKRVRQNHSPLLEATDTVEEMCTRNNTAKVHVSEGKSNRKKTFSTLTENCTVHNLLLDNISRSNSGTINESFQQEAYSSNNSHSVESSLNLSESEKTNWHDGFTYDYTQTFGQVDALCQSSTTLIDIRYCNDETLSNKACGKSEQSLHVCTVINPRSVMHESNPIIPTQPIKHVPMVVNKNSEVSTHQSLYTNKLSSTVCDMAAIDSNVSKKVDQCMSIEHSSPEGSVFTKHDFSNNFNCMKPTDNNVHKLIHTDNNLSDLSNANNVSSFNTNISSDLRMYLSNVDSNIPNQALVDSGWPPIRTYSKLCKSSIKVYPPKLKSNVILELSQNVNSTTIDQIDGCPTPTPLFNRSESISTNSNTRFEGKNTCDDNDVLNQTEVLNDHLNDHVFQSLLLENNFNHNNAKLQSRKSEDIVDELSHEFHSNNSKCSAENHHEEFCSEQFEDTMTNLRAGFQLEDAFDDFSYSRDGIDNDNVGFDQCHENDYSDDSSTTCRSEDSETNSHSSESINSNNEDHNRPYFKEHKMEGRRISDLTWVFEQLHEAFNSHNGSCEGRFRDLRIRQSFNKGLRTLMVWECKKCEKIARIWTDPEKSSERLNIHEAATLGTLISGTGFSALEEQLTAMDIPFMSQPTYRQYRDKVGETIYKVSREDMKKAGQLEMKLALQAGDIIKGRNGNPDRPFIKVIVDGAWSKRSYRGGRYDALSGTAVIIGHRTGLILWCGIRNKCCTGCERNSDHLNCVKNWGRDQASTSMETDIITEGFRNSIELHGLIYKCVVGDGDSSVYKSIIDSDPYAEYGIRVEKIECKNHLFRNFCDNIEEVAKKTKFVCQVEKGLVTNIRDEVKMSALKMRVYIEKAMISRKNGNDTLQQKTTCLLNDINNTPYHIFGDHKNCEKVNQTELTEDCKKIPHNNVPYLKKIGMFGEVEAKIARLAINVSSLLENVTSNSAELYNSLANKFHGGRRINNSMRNSFELRAHCAVIQFNNKVILSRVITELGKPVSSNIVKMEKSRLNQVEYTKKYRSNGGRKRRRYHGTDKDYGPFASKPDLSLFEYNKRKEDHLTKLEERQSRREQIQKETINQSACGDWYMYRADMITASNFGAICNKRAATSCAGIVKSIRFSPPLNTESILFGKDNEKNAIRKLEEVIKKKIEPCGLFIDKDLEFLGASPDGLIDSDGIVEIKCLASAKHLTPDEAIEQSPQHKNIFNKENNNKMNTTHKYYYQVQGQLHITGREYCLFAIWTPLGLRHIKVLKDDKFWSDQMEVKLTRFFYDCLLPEIVDSRLARKMPIRNPDYILEAQEAAKKKKEMKLQKQADKKNSNGKKSPKKRQKRMTRAAKIASRTISTDDSSNEDEEYNQWVAPINDTSVTLTDEQVQALNIVRDNISIEDVIQNITAPMTQLTDDSIELFLQILSKNSLFTTLPVLHTVISNLMKPSETNQDLQIIGGNQSGHWTCLFYNGESICIYDSLTGDEKTGLSADERTFVINRYPWIDPGEIIFKNVTRQGNDLTICGVYSAAFATSIALGEDPSSVNYSVNAEEMRNHLASIIHNGTLTLFPKQKVH